MIRNLEKFLEWKSDANKKPLVVKGARQVGKTWAIKEFGKQYYKNVVYFNFDANEELFQIFEANKNPQRIIDRLSFLSEEKILPHETLIVLDEIQECSAALNSLKYFCEDAREYDVVAAGSLLGTLLAKPKSYPVGKVNILKFYPMSFSEYLNATDPKLHEFYNQIKNGELIEDIFHNSLLERFDEYLIIGGMPECVKAWIEEKDAQKVAKIQNDLIELYENDFSKHNGKVNAARLLMSFRSIPSQLAKENKKFIFGCIKEGARAREFEEAVEWLVSAGMFNRVYNVSKIEQPLKSFDIFNHFKIYLFDTGILKQMAGVGNKAILLDEDFQFKGALAENFILQQLKQNQEIEPRYYSVAGGMELDFLLQKDDEIIPVEVKAGKNKNASSFKNYISKANPKCAIRFSRMNYKKQDNLVNIPLYLAERMWDLV